MDLYRRIPELGEPALIHENVPPGATILDLGAGVGRIADPLVALGHRVVAVDESAEMLSYVRAAVPVLSRIETLDLDEKFDAAILASHLANADSRRILFQAARRHLIEGGVAIMEWHPSEWFDGLTTGETPSSKLGEVTSKLQIHKVEPDNVEATVTYELATEKWTQNFQATRVPESKLRADLEASGLTFDHYLNESQTWFLTRTHP